MKVKAKIVARYENEGKLKAVATVCLDGEFLVTGVRVVECRNGLAVFMPSREVASGEYRDICFPTTAAMREAINTVVMDAYRGELEQQAVRAAQAVERLSGRNVEKPSVRQALQDAAREAAARSSPAADRTMDQRAR